MILATLSTPNFDFIALGMDEAHARRIITRAWNKHAGETGASLSAADVLEDTSFVEIQAGDALRDGSPIVQAVG